MSVTIKIPEGSNPFICEINGVKYYYTAGSTATVPDEVAALITQNAGNFEKPIGLPDISIPRDGSAGQVLYRTSDGAKWDALPADELPAVSSTNNGKYLKVVSGAWAIGDGYTLPAATTAAKGGVKQCANMTAEAAAEEGALVTLVAALKAAGIMEADAASE